MLRFAASGRQVKASGQAPEDNLDVLRHAAPSREVEASGQAPEDNPDLSNDADQG